MHYFIYKLSSTEYIYNISRKLVPILYCLSFLFMLFGMLLGLLFTPADFQQGDGFRIIYIHVPCAVLSLCIYIYMSLCALLALIWRTRISFIFMRACASVGAIFTLITLLTGAIWGKPMWGTWWVWDARLTSELILLFIYIGCIGLLYAFEDFKQGSIIAAYFILIGLVDIPVIHFSVDWWNTLHQGASLSLLDGSTIAKIMLYPLFVMFISFSFYALALILLNTKLEILKWDRKKKWVRSLIINKR